jgi:hypothetical protein
MMKKLAPCLLLVGACGTPPVWSSMPSVHRGTYIVECHGEAACDAALMHLCHSDSAGYFGIESATLLSKKRDNVGSFVAEYFVVCKCADNRFVE